MSMDRRAYLTQNYLSIRQRILECCQNCGRSIEEVKLIAVSKFFPATDIEIIRKLGQLYFGESRVQEWQLKQATLEETIHWHLIGTLQKNKVNKVVGQVELIHSIDSASLLQKIENRARQLNLEQDVLLQVKMVEDDNKCGLTPQEIAPLMEQYRDTNVRIRGLMTISPLFDQVAKSEYVFCLAEELFLSLAADERQYNDHFDCLSMGMSEDYPFAIRHGSTHVRIGSALFGTRS